MIRRFMLIFLVIGVFYLLTWLNKNKLQKRYPFLKRINSTLTIVSWVLLTTYCLTFIYWFFSEIF